MEGSQHTIADWMIDLIRDKPRFEKFKAHPESVIQQSPLSKEQKEVLLSRNADKIRGRMQHELGKHAAISMHLVIPMHWGTMHQVTDTSDE